VFHVSERDARGESTIMTESDIVRAFLIAVPEHIPDCLVFQRPIVNATATAKGKSWRVRAGVPGQADCYAVASGGIHVELEMKAARGVMAEHQLRWRERCFELHIPHLVLRAKANEDATETVMRWVDALHEVINSTDWRHFGP
jgi:hypothetical protein